MFTASALAGLAASLESAKVSRWLTLSRDTESEMGVAVGWGSCPESRISLIHKERCRLHMPLAKILE